MWPFSSRGWFPLRCAEFPELGNHGKREEHLNFGAYVRPPPCSPKAHLRVNMHPTFSRGRSQSPCFDPPGLLRTEQSKNYRKTVVFRASPLLAMDLAAEFIDRHKEKAIASLKTRALGVSRAVSSTGRGKRELLGLDDSFGI